MSVKRINNVNFNYELLGDARNHHLVFISGYTCDINSWQSIANQLKNYFYILIFDNQGIGETRDENNPLSIDIMAQNIKALIDNSGLKNPIISGFAMGSTIAQTIAFLYTKDVSQLILISSLMKWGSHAKNLCEKLCTLREENKLYEYAEVIYETCFSEIYKNHNSKAAVVKGLAEILLHSQTTSGQRRQVEALKAFDSNDWAGDIKVPTIVISPEFDQFATPAEGKQLSDQVNGRYVIVNDCGHAILDEKPEILIEIFKDASSM